MHADSGAGRASPEPSLESDARHLAVWIEKRKYLVLCALTILYLVGSVSHARSKPLRFPTASCSCRCGITRPNR
jgi:hypothetical protein